MSDQEEDHEFKEQPDTKTRLQDLTDEGRGYIVVCTRAYGPDGEDLIDHEGPRFSGEPGIKIHVKQGDVEEDVILSPFFGDPSKVWTEDFEEGKKCELTVPQTGEPLDKIPGMTSEDGGEYFAVYLSDDLEEGELVAVNNVWGNYDSRILSEGELLKAYADAGESEEYHKKHDE